MARTVIVGGGIAGLAAAHRLLELEPSADVTVLEGAERPGGLLATEHTDGYVIERGPDAILAAKPAALRLAERLGLGDEIVSTRAEHRGAYVVCRGKLERVPEGFSLLAPTAVGPFLRSPILSWRGKARASLDLVLPRRRGKGEESLASFVERRFGRELLERLAQPLVGGIYGADAARLSLTATMPRFMEIERIDRSVSRGLRRRGAMRGEAGARYGLFASFRGGMQTLVDALARRLGDRVRPGKRVVSIHRAGEGWQVGVEGGDRLPADRVVVAVPAWRAASMLRGYDAVLASHLESIPYGSAVTVTLAWRREEIPHPLDAFGFVVPRIERRPLLACTWASVKWPGRAPAGHELVRAFIGGPDFERAVEWSDERLLATARAELAALMGVSAQPSLVRIDRYRRAMPRYELGHLARVERIEELASDHPGLALAGNAYRGVGIPDAVASGEAAAEAILGHRRGSSEVEPEVGMSP